MKWLEVSIIVNGELAEAIAELLTRYAPGNVVLEELLIENSGSESRPIGPVSVRAYLPCDERLKITKRAVEQGLWHLGQIQSLPEPVYRLIQEEDWAQAWKSHYHPIPIGRRLMILPSWSDSSSGDRLPVILDPGMAFGTGIHPTTQLCLIALEDYLRPGQIVIDLGCGSGILSIAAARLGAGYVQAFDIDPQAVKVARKNVQINHLSEQILVRHGTLSDVLEAKQETNPPVDLLVANILASTIEQMIERGLSQAVKHGGLIILSGILDRQVAPLISICDQHGLLQIETRAHEDWRAFILKVI